MIEDGPLQTSDTGPRSRSKPSDLIALAIRIVPDFPTGIGSHGTELIARHTWPPSWSVAAMRRWRSAARTVAISDFIEAAVVALWFRFTLSSPPNCRCFQSASTALVRLPRKPTMITAPISSFNVSLPGPSCWVGLGDGDGDDAAEGVLDGRDGLDTA